MLEFSGLIKLNENLSANEAFSSSYYLFTVIIFLIIDD